MTFTKVASTKVASTGESGLMGMIMNSVQTSRGMPHTGVGELEIGI
jgi:hypothetical protein